MRALLVGGIVAVLILAEAAHVGSVNGGTLILAGGAGVLAFGAVRWWQYEGRKLDRLIGDALHPNRQVDRDDRAFRTVKQGRAGL